MNHDDKPTFTGTVRKQGESYYLLIRPELVNFLNIEHRDEMKVQAETGKHGKYVSAWNPEQQNE